MTVIDALALSVKMDRLTVFGLAAVTAMLAFYALEDRSPAFVLAFAFACIAGSAYGFMQGAWPFGAVEAVWSLIAVRRWWHARRTASIPRQSGGRDMSERDHALANGNRDS